MQAGKSKNQQDSFRKIDQLQKVLSEAPGVEIAHKLDQFMYSLQLFDRNFVELNQIVKVIKSEKMGGHNLFYRPNYWMTEILRSEFVFRLHNYVASSKSLLDHSRIVYSNLFEAKGNMKLYEIETQKLSNNEIVRFVQEFRDMCQHFRLPNIALMLKWGEDLTILYVTKRSLLEFSGWKSKAKKFILNQTQEEIDLMELLNEYNSIIKDFHKWVRQKYIELHKEELSIISKLENEIREQQIQIISYEIKEALGYPKKEALGRIMLALGGIITAKEGSKLLKFREDPCRWIKQAISVIQPKVKFEQDLVDKIMTLVDSD